MVKYCYLSSIEWLSISILINGSHGQMKVLFLMTCVNNYLKHTFHKQNSTFTQSTSLCVSHGEKLTQKCYNLSTCHVLSLACIEWVMD